MLTIEKAIKMAKADLECLEHDTSGQNEMCNNHKCDECELNYKRGNIGEQKEWLNLVIKILEQEHCSDAISRQTALDLCERFDGCVPYSVLSDHDMLPPVTPQQNMRISETKKQIVIDNYFKAECDVNTSIKEAFTKGFELGLKKAPTNSQPNIGHWIEERNDYGEITGWHCDKCYEDTGFTTTCKWDHCPSCGAKMIELQERGNE